MIHVMLLVRFFCVFLHSKSFDGESSLPSICLCCVMSVLCQTFGLPTTDSAEAIMRSYRRHDSIFGYLDLGAEVFSLCPACSRPGLSMHTDSRRLHCHRCRAVTLELVYGKLLEIDGFTIGIKRMILWFIFRHPFDVFRDEARALRILHMTNLLRGTAWTYNLIWNTREAMQREIRRGVLWKGKRYRVGRLSICQDFLSLVFDFLFSEVVLPTSANE